MKKKENIEASSNMSALIVSRLVMLSVLVFAASFFFQKIQFVTADLGRFIQNGALFFEEGEMLFSNHYSYTEPDYPFGNHHWGIGLIYYIVHKSIGFLGLSYLNMILIVSSIFLFVRTLRHNLELKYLSLAILLCLPLINWRVEIRPEFFSYALLGVVYYFVWRFIHNKVPFKRLLIVVLPIMILWVNLHIFFVIGLSVIGAVWVCSIALRSYKAYSKELGILFGASLLVSLINPGGVWGLLEPFNIFREYGYMVAENMSVAFMQDRYPSDYKYPYMEFLLVVLLLLSAYFFFIKKKLSPEGFLLNDVEDGYKLQAILVLCFAIPAFSMIRFMPVLGLVLIPFVAWNIKYCIQEWVGNKHFSTVTKLLIALPLLFIFLGCSMPKGNAYRYWNPKWNPQNSGMGLPDNMNKGADVFKKLKIKGPVLNNYDIGGYLIYNLYPEYKVFTDNRPEAYSVDFFKNTYYPMHEFEDSWRQVDEKYKFNAIYYYRHDNTEHGQPFLIRRLQDPNWAPVFVDDWTIIILKRNQQNSAIIKRFELPPSMFSVRK